MYGKGRNQCDISHIEGLFKFLQATDSESIVENEVEMVHIHLIDDVFQLTLIITRTWLVYI